MRFKACSGLFLAACALSACGGSSGGGSMVSTPAPTPTPTNTSLTNLQSTETFEGRGAINSFTLNAVTGSVNTSGGTRINGPVQVTFNASNNSYTIQNSERSLTFGNADRVAAASTAVLTAYEKEVGTVSDSFLLFNPGPANTQLALTYTSYGAWQTITTGTSTLGVNTTFFVFGVKTAPSSLPTTGTASYQGIVDGQFAGSAGVFALGGTSNVSANFGSGTISFSTAVTGQNILTAANKNFGTITGTGTINASGASFQAATAGNSGNGYSFSMLGQFFGPGAAEVGASFQILGADGVGNGAIVAKKN